MSNNRRDFIKTSIVAGTGLALGLSSFQSWGGVFGKKVRLAVIGTGGRGRFLMEHLLNQMSNNDTYELVAICDNYQPSMDAAKKICNKYKITPKTFDDYKKLMADAPVDGVIIATPLYQHAHITIDCLNAGIHVLCEKSMARTLSDAKAMYDASIKSGSILIIGHQRMFNKKYLNGIERIHAGEFGPVGQVKAYWHRNKDWRRPIPEGKPELERQLNWRLYKEYSAGLLTELMSHQIQVSNWAFQNTPVSVQASGGIQFWKDGREVPDNLAAIFTYADGSRCIADYMNMNRNYGVEEHIIADYATLRMETNKLQWDKPNQTVNGPMKTPVSKMVDDIKKGEKKPAAIGGASWRPETAKKTKEESIYEGQKGDGTVEELLTFVEFIKTKSAPDWMLREGYNASLWTLLTEKAIDTGKTVTCPKKYMI
ncbi:Gfo/Idh/MocA family protein [Reichenbachiella versicolor]|uniref:Gfo/Idh/MocA family protein n=1 Tax=Reichenbachiella versicolor TaxID=1821036 RepID=UPI000D6DE51A|nr:Gfo/Idh/MocA family oxidoreductase [Reichenbachiella versicolor]